MVGGWTYNASRNAERGGSDLMRGDDVACQEEATGRGEAAECEEHFCLFAFGFGRVFDWIAGEFAVMLEGRKDCQLRFRRWWV